MTTMLKKVTIPSSNTKAVAFFEALNKKKEDLKKKLTKKPFMSPDKDKHGKSAQ